MSLYRAVELLLNLDTRSMRALPLLAAVFLCSNCGTDRTALLPIPEPDLSKLRPEVIEQLRSRRTKLGDIYTRTGGRGQQLAIAFGEMGRLYHAYQLHEPAAVCYTNAAVLQPGEFRWHYYLGQLQSTIGANDVAVTELVRAARIRPGYIPTLVALGKLHYEAGDYANARKRFDSILEIDNRNALAHFYLGQVAFDQDRFQEAVDHFVTALSIQPDASRIQYPLAMAYQGIGDQASAQRHLARRGNGPLTINDPLMLELRDLTLGARQYLDAGAVAIRNGNYRRAVSLLSDAVAAEPENVLAHYNLGSALIKVGQGAAAMEHYREALRLDPGYVPAHYDLATVLAFQGDYSEALDHLHVVNRIDPGYRTLLFKLGTVLAKLDRCDEATTYFRKALARNPADQLARDALRQCAGQ